MDKTLTVRIPAEQQKLLANSAKQLGKSVSALVREILQQALSQRPLSARTGHLKGRLRLGDSRQDAWRQRLRERNWRP